MMKFWDFVLMIRIVVAVTGENVKIRHVTASKGLEAQNVSRALKASTEEYVQKNALQT